MKKLSMRHDRSLVILPDLFGPRTHLDPDPPQPFDSLLMEGSVGPSLRLDNHSRDAVRSNDLVPPRHAGHAAHLRRGVLRRLRRYQHAALAGEVIAHGFGSRTQYPSCVRETASVLLPPAVNQLIRDAVGVIDRTHRFRHRRRRD